MTPLTRRALLRSGACALAATAAPPRFLVRAAAGAETRGRVVVAIFQRGAVDGLGMVPPHGDPAYAAARPAIALARPRRGDSATALDLDGVFALHPSLAPLESLWRARTLAVVHACGSPDSTRSHFDAQDYMESATPGLKATRDGWLNRYLQVSSEERNPLRGVALARTMPRSLEGGAPALAIGSVDEFGVRGTAAAFESQYESASDPLLRAAGHDAFAAMRTLRQAAASPYRADNGALWRVTDAEKCPKIPIRARYRTLQGSSNIIHIPVARGLVVGPSLSDAEFEALRRENGNLQPELTEGRHGTPESAGQ